jgi:hypothetical protein
MAQNICSLSTPKTIWAYQNVSQTDERTSQPTEPPTNQLSNRVIDKSTKSLKFISDVLTHLAWTGLVQFVPRLNWSFK